LLAPVDPTTAGNDAAWEEGHHARPACAYCEAEEEPHRPPRAAGSYHVLEIEPLRTLFRTEGRSEELGLGQALHICRGHFADHRGKGLFGKVSIRGIFWVPMHVRGTTERGTVRKDYEVTP